MADKIKAHTALFVVALIYGSNYSIAKYVMDDGYIQPFGFILLRVIGGVGFFWAIHRLWIREKIDRKDIPLLAICGLFGVAINQLFFFAGLSLTKPINAALIMTTTPILVLVISALFLKEAITGRKIIGVLLGVIGAVLLITQGKAVSFSSDQVWGDLMVFINASSFGIYLVLVKKMTQKYHPLTIVKWVFSFGLLVVLPFGWQQLGAVAWHTFPLSVWWSVLFVLVCTTFVTYLFNAFALSIVNASTVSMYIFLQPFFATLIALIFGMDILDSIKIVSATLIFVGVYLVSIRPTKI